MPVPPPIEENFSMMSMMVAASTQVAIAKYPLRNRETSHHSGSAATPHPIVATGSAANGEVPLSAMNACTMMAVVPEYTMQGNIASTTTTISAPAPVQATFLRDRVTRNRSAE